MTPVTPRVTPHAHAHAESHSAQPGGTQPVTDRHAPVTSTAPPYKGARDVIRAVPTKPLGSRQRLALELLTEHGTVTALDVGAAIHAARGTHPADSCCPWCRLEGADVLASLARRRTNGRQRLLVLDDATASLPRRAEQ